MHHERTSPHFESERRFSKLSENYSRRYAQLDPVVASAVGDHSQDRRLLDRVCEYRLPFPLLPERRDAIKTHMRATRKELSAIDPLHLNPQAEHFYRVLDWDLGTRLDLLNNCAELIPFGPQQLSMLWELPVDASGRGRQSFQTVEDYENFFARMEEFPEWVTTAKANLDEGKQRGYTAPKILILATLNQLGHFLANNQSQSTALSPIRNMPDNFSDSDKQRLEKDYDLIYHQAIYQKYVLLYNYLREYFPSGRDDTEAGMKHLPNGLEEYQRLIRFHTGSNMSIETLSEMVDMELEDSLEGIERCRSRIKFKGSIEEFIDAMDKKFMSQLFSSPVDLQNFHNRVKEQTMNVLPELVGTIPTTDYDLRLIDGEPAQHATAQHRRASHDGSQRASLWLPFRPTPNVRIDNRANMLRTIFHEGLPGHHLQFALQDIANVPSFIQHANFPAFIEGWAIHAEELGHKYIDPHNKDLEFAIIYTKFCVARAAKIDLGIHGTGWSLEEARNFRRRYFGEVGKDEDTDIIRMTDWAAQVFSYLVGAPAISDFKKVLQRELENKYDERLVNSALLKKGSMPLELLPLVGEQVINEMDAS